MNIVITGGGTGGHVYPAISIAQTLKDIDKSINILYVGSINSIEERIAKDNKIDFVGVHSASLPALKSSKCFCALSNLIKGVNEAKKTLNDFNADIVFGTGGYVCYPVFTAQKMRKKPIVVHEQNALAGTTNKQIANYASYICTTFANEDFPKEKIVRTGLPIRKIFRETREKKLFAENFSINKDEFVLLVCGGSQGAKSINDSIVNILPKLRDLNIKVIHQTGKNKYSDVVEKTQDKYNDFYKAYDYLDMCKALNVADLVIGRAGASTLTEILTQNVPAILIPFPFAAGNHQFYNAKSSADAGATILIEEKNLTDEILFNKIKELIGNREKLKSMSENCQKVLVSEPEAKIAEVIFKAVK